LLTTIGAELRGFIGNFIPKIAELLKRKSPHMRVAAAEVLSKLSEQGM
jgi:hypothetical protein